MFFRSCIHTVCAGFLLKLRFQEYSMCSFTWCLCVQKNEAICKICSPLFDKNTYHTFMVSSGFVQEVHTGIRYCRTSYKMCQNLVNTLHFRARQRAVHCGAAVKVQCTWCCIIKCRRSTLLRLFDTYHIYIHVYMSICSCGGHTQWTNVISIGSFSEIQYNTKLPVQNLLAQCCRMFPVLFSSTKFLMCTSVL